jgi:hypothetical protein
MNTNFEELYEQIMNMFEMVSADVVGTTPHTGDYTINYAPNDSRNIVGNKSINSIPDPNKKKKGKKKKGIQPIMPLQRRPSINENIEPKTNFDIYVQQTERGQLIKTPYPVEAVDEKDAIRQYLIKKRGTRGGALTTSHLFKIEARRSKPVQNWWD